MFLTSDVLLSFNELRYHRWNEDNTWRSDYFTENCENGFSSHDLDNFSTVSCDAFTIGSSYRGVKLSSPMPRSMSLPITNSGQ